MNPATADSHPRKSAFRNSAALPIHPSTFIIPPSSTPSLPDARPHSDRPQCAGRESNFLATTLKEESDFALYTTAIRLQSREPSFMKTSRTRKADSTLPGSALLRWISAVSIIVILVGCGIFALNRYRRDEPRRSALAVISEIDRALTSSEVSKTMPLLELSPAVAARSPEDQMQWIADVLRDEVSAAGLDELRRHARFGPLAQVFPEEAKRWAESAHLAVESCVAFRMERAGIRAEVVLHQTPTGFRVLRCNNVKQMALAAVTKP